MQIEITPELLADLKEKAGKATQGEWYCRFVYDRKFTSITTHERRWAGMPGVAEISMTNIDNPVDIEIKQNANAEYIAAANPAVMLALIAKIEDLQNKIHNLESWMEYNQDMMDRDSDFKYKLKVMLSLMKNSDPPVDDYKRMLEAVRKLVANAKATTERLSKLEKDALFGIKHKGRYAPYMLINSNEILTMITEIKELRKLADPQTLTAAYMAGAIDAKEKNE